MEISASIARGAAWAFALLWTASFFARTLSAEDRDYFSAESAPQAWAVAANAQWMKRVDGRANLAALSIPGTHDSCARSGGVYAECQSLALKDQFDIGIRFLDIRCRRWGDHFPIHHGMVFQKIDFGEVQKACIDFLTANPSECIVMNVQEEYSPGDKAAPFETTFKNYIKDHENFWYTAAAIPTLGDVRGKIVLVGRAGGIGGLPWSTFDLQNDWTIPTPLQIPEKWAKVKRKLEDAAAGLPEKWYLNFASGAGIAAFPRTVALDINKSLLALLNDEKRRRVGTILMDFPGENLIDKIIRTNFEK